MSEERAEGAGRKQPIQFRFSGGSDLDNDLFLYGLTFDEALKVTVLVAEMMRARKSDATPPQPRQDEEGRSA